MVPQHDLRNGDHHIIPPLSNLLQQQQIENFESATTPDDYLDQMLSSLPSWNDFATDQKGHCSKQPAWDLTKQSAAMLGHHQINGNGMSSMLQQQQQLASQNGVGDGSSSLFNSSGLESSIQGLYNGFAESHQFLQSQSQGQAPPRQRVRARRGQATDPHSIAERQRRERIAERMKGLQELVPNTNKTDKASMLDGIIDYVKFLQLQVKVLSMSQLGGAAAVAPLLAGRGDAIPIGSGAQMTSGDDSALTMPEQQVVKLMEEDMGSAMQYLQGKGLCLMPISLASAISTSTSHFLIRNTDKNNANCGMFLSNGNGAVSPSASVLTVQSSAFVNDAT